MFIIRKGRLDDLQEMLRLFEDAIVAICKTDYNKAQIEAWISNAKNNGGARRWREILTNQIVLIAQKDEKIVGFAALCNKNYIDLFYIHKDHQRQGIAKKLYAEIEKEARIGMQKALTSDVSITARPFFEKQNFKAHTEQLVNINGVSLTNYKMIKMLDEGPTC